MALVSLLLSDPKHPIMSRLVDWTTHNAKHHQIELCHRSSDLSGGDFLFLVSCHEIIRAPVRNRYRYSLVLHASDLPQGRGMSPHIWQILEGRNEFVLTLLDAEDQVDSGNIWNKRLVQIDSTALWYEIDEKLFDAEIELLDWALTHCDSSCSVPQQGTSTHYPRRTPEDSRLDLSKPLIDSFNILRVANPDRYPAWFEVEGKRFVVKIEKMPS